MSLNYDSPSSTVPSPPRPPLPARNGFPSRILSSVMEGSMRKNRSRIVDQRYMKMAGIEVQK